MGETLLSQIDHKKTIKDKEKMKLIKYIIKKSDKYNEQYLSDLDYNDVKDIFDEIKYENRSFFKKILEIFN
jgi:hypothetical protein